MLLKAFWVHKEVGSAIVIEILHLLGAHLGWLNLILALKRFWQHTAVEQIFQLHIDNTATAAHDFWPYSITR